MNWLEIIVIVVTLVATFIGWRTGVIRAILTLVGIGPERDGKGVLLVGSLFVDNYPVILNLIPEEFKDVEGLLPRLRVPTSRDCYPRMAHTDHD